MDQDMKIDSEIKGDIVLPGDEIGDINDYDIGVGVYINNNKIISSILGYISILPSSYNSSDISNNKSIISVQREEYGVDRVLHEGGLVLGRIIEIQLNQITISILSYLNNNNNEFINFTLPYNGILRKENIQKNEIDKIILLDLFQPNDIIIAKLISLGDSKYYFLSTIDDNLGVVYSLNPSNQNIMTNHDNQYFIDPITKQKYTRKIANLDDNINIPL